MIGSTVKIVAAAAGFAAVSAGGAAAADAVPYDPAPAAQAPVVQTQHWGFKVGAIGLVSPKYEGSDEVRFVGFPLIIPQYYGDNYDPNVRPRFSFKGLGDVRYAVLRYGDLDVGPLAGYTFGRDEDDGDLLDGIGDVDGGLILGGFAAYHFGPFYVDGALASQVTGDPSGSYTVKAGVGMDYKATERLVLSPYISTTFASDKFMDNYFSVSPGQSAASTSGLPVYDADAGFKNVSFQFGADYRLTKRWTASGSVDYSRLIGDAADSPVTADENQFSGSLQLTYTFGRTD